MNIIRFKRPKIGTVLTTISPFLTPDVEDQKKIILEWSKIVPRVLVIGDIEPLKADGVRHVKAPRTINNLIATYAQSIPGLEGVVLTNPNVVLDADGLQDLAKYVESERMELTWGTSQGKTFFMSSQIAAHLLNDLPSNTLFNSDWQGWLDAWLRRMLRQRYIDVSKMSLIKTSTPDHKHEVIPPPPPAKRKKPTVRKVKLNA